MKPGLLILGAKIQCNANQPWKVEAFATADAVITSMGDVLSALSSA